MRDAFISELVQLAEIDERIVLLTGDLGFGVVEKFSEKFPDRFWNCGVAEQSMMSIAAGLARAGLRPYVYSIANFPTFRCLEQIRNDVCYHNLPVTIVSVGGGLGYGTLGYTHHGIEDMAALRSLPNIAIYSPADPSQTREVLNKINNNEEPAYLRLGKNGEPLITKQTLNQIQGSIYEFQPGTDLTVIATGAISENCLNASNELGFEKNIQVISISKVHPLDVSYLANLISSSNVVVVEEHVERGGLASSILEGFNKLGLNINLKHIYVHEKMISQTGSQNYLRGLSGMDPASLAKTFKKFLEV